MPEPTPGRPYTSTAIGWVLNPAYRPQTDPRYQGNPLIEALQPILTDEQLRRTLQRYPAYDPAHRALPNEIRWGLLDTVDQFIYVMPEYVNLARNLATLIRNGYVGRNPRERGFRKTIDAAVEAIADDHSFAPSHLQKAGGLAQLGDPGVGKTTMTKLALALNAQVYQHRAYDGEAFKRIQLTYLYVICPPDGSRKAVCEAILQEMDSVLDTDYYHMHGRNGEASKNQMVAAIAKLAGEHHLGALVIDEIQALADVRRQDTAQLLNFFVSLIDQLRLPIVLIGGASALQVLKDQARLARRLDDQGSTPWCRMTNGEPWRDFVRALWRYQYLRQPTPYTDKLADALYEQCLGIPDYAVKIFRFAQRRAIHNAANTPDGPNPAKERITVGSIRSVAYDSLHLSRARLRWLATTPGESMLPVMDDFVFNEIHPAPPPASAPPPVEEPPQAGESPAAAVPAPASAAGTVPLAPTRARAARADGPAQEGPIAPPGSAHGLVASGKDDGRSGYASMKEGGLTRSTAEFLRGDE